ncbi:putative 3-oxoacyl-(acyl-carrier-protein) reductase [Myxococcus xanthus DK 1622]|uniref:3-oxoacyl-(Acyl-carrier-protein) reductase n=1 Tax=Myxococcus xanthus (strain DK1622) TaxID=246197 RepID=Q1CYK0_MYXXD|nr:putative 3-oxoacyl-(acyl-carrier-protein) reductase [Myxococcus xanthus DK 1622]NOJ52387.1 3-oxoacyl-ACP reductase FabG [Myxococcus xanthus]QPM78742.1 3-oxoacyl-ACP reductase FabG [Myxococcus xanthus]QVW67813.1 3-oxoacyl-ACP reductase FabG [Myxococcus xanthus DZ2]UEO06066.1 3-oxoacyl-ACP reductase FabG [Myxococcus xanthus DZ2]
MVSESQTTRQRFQQQTVIITGGSRGIGKAIALAFAAEGADIVLNYGSNAEAARQAAAEVEAQGRRCVLVPGSVASPDVPGQLREAALSHFGRIDVLVNNAGISRDGHLMMLQAAAWRETVDVNLYGALACCQAVIPTMMQQGRGAIINMSSSAGIRGRAGQVPYAATKGALIGLTQALAGELGPHGIRVNCVAPGFVETEMVAGLMNRPGVREGFIQATPIRRLGTVEDVANATLFLASPESAYVVGDVLRVNGGLVL